MSKPNPILDYFTFGRGGQRSAGRAEAMSASASSREYKLLGWFGQYIAVALGVALQPLISQMLKELPLDLGYLTSIRLIASLAIAMLIFPGAYRPAAATTPRFVQFCVLFGGGVGWQAIVQSMLTTPPA